MDVLETLESVFAGWPIPIGPNTRFAVALSGGLDSSCLLTSISRLALPRQLRALHVDHGLHPESARWAGFCAELAAEAGAHFHAEQIDVEPQPGESLEAIARTARYAALRRALRPGEVLLTAHHADDQLETELFRLLRGAGVSGMRGIVAFGEFGDGYLGRPLLTLTRAQIERTAREWNLRWIEDPSNEDTRFDRNYLRKEVIPVLRKHWPGAAAASVRVGAAMHDAEEILRETAQRDAGSIEDIGRMPCEWLRSLSPARTRNLLRYAIRELELPMPGSRHLAELMNGLSVRRPDAQTCVSWRGGEARIYRDHLYLQAPLPSRSELGAIGHLSATQRFVSPVGELELRPSTEIGLPDSWVQEGLEVAYRRGGEVFRPWHGAHERPLKKWFQEAGIVPWMRQWIPLIMRDDAIVAIADLGLSDAVREAGEERCWSVHWRAHPRLR